MPGSFKIEWRIREDVEAASHNWRPLNTFSKLEEMQSAFDRLNHAGQIEFRKIVPEVAKSKEEKKESFFNQQTDEQSNGTGKPDNHNSGRKNVPSKEQGNRSQLPLL